MSDYTPPTEVIRQAVTFERNRPGEPRTIKVEAFERWLAAHDAEVAATALERAGARIGFARLARIDRRSDGWWLGMDEAERMLHARADAEYRKTETEGK